MVYQETGRPRPWPVATWALMAAALLVTLLLPDWSGSGIPRSLWFVALPLLLAFAGAGLAVKAGQLWWAGISAAWGLVLLNGLFVLITVISGP